MGTLTEPYLTLYGSYLDARADTVPGEVTPRLGHVRFRLIHQWVLDVCSAVPAQEGSRLRRRAFHDAPFLTTSLKVIKSFILNADVHRGPQFLRFKVRWVARCRLQMPALTL